MIRPQVLIHRTDVDIDSELEQAVQSINGVDPVLHYGNSLRETVAAASDFQPAIFMVDLSENLETVRVLIEEAVAACPDVTIVGICPFGGTNNTDESTLMMSALRLGVEDFVRRPLSSIELTDLFNRRIANRREKKSTPGSLVSFVSNKGGVGKSTCAVNVAVELAKRNPDRVILIDASLQMGVCATHLNLEPEATITDAWNQKDRLDQQLFQQLTTIHESGLHLLAAPSNAIEAAEIDDAFLSRILLLARRTYDYVIVDTFPLFDRSIMAILDLSDQAYIISDNVVPTLKTIRGFFQLLTDVGFSEDRWQIVLNRYSTKAGAPSMNDVENYLGRGVDHIIPFDNKVILSANLGQPLMQANPRWNKTGQRIKDIADGIESLAVNGNSGSLVETPSPAPHSDMEGA